MKKLVSFFLAAGLLLALSACGSTAAITPAHAEQPAAETETNILVAIFSRTGHTQPYAEAAAEYLGADIYQIEALVPYTDDDIKYYTGCRADKEQEDPSVRPEISGSVENMDKYDVIILGYPIWHGQAPRIISTFLESYNFSGKTIIPFCTSQSSDIGSSDDKLHDLCDAQWVDGKRFPPEGSTELITDWLYEVISGLFPAEGENMKLNAYINGTEIPVVWESNASVAQLCEYARGGEISVSMQKYGGWEQVGSLGRSIIKNDTNQTAHCGDIMLYCGNQIVLFYGENTWAYTKLGHIELSDSEIASLLGSGDVTVSLSAE